MSQQQAVQMPKFGARVYSYTRFSTPEQAGGDSRRRQTEAAQRWASAKGLVLDERLSLNDLGVSAYRGSNVQGDSGLAGFLEACRQGLIAKGSYLLVESLDRISRMTPRRVQRLLDEIVDAGVTICTLNDGQEYDAARLDNDPTALLIALMVAWRAHEESKTKGRRVAAAWEEKRRKVRARETRKLTAKCPAWLRWTDRGWELLQPQAKTVRRIFDMTVAGLGEHKIVQILNSENVETMGRANYWHRSTVAKILRNPSVIGELMMGYLDYSTGQRVRGFEEPLAGYYPAAVTSEQWLAVRAIKELGSVRGRGVVRPLSNLFAGLARCPLPNNLYRRVLRPTSPP